MSAGRATVCAVALALGALAVWAPAAAAAGTGGVEITPAVVAGGVADASAGSGGHGSSAFRVRLSRHGRTAAAFDIRNLSDTTVSARVYAAGAVAQAGSYAVGGAGSAPWIELPDQVVRLAPRESRHIEFTLVGDRAPAGAVAHGAIVEEPTEVSSLHLRVATLVYAQRAAQDVAPPSRNVLASFTAAVAILGVLVGAVIVAARARVRR